MSHYFSQQEMAMYVEHVLSKGALEAELKRTREYMVGSTVHPLADKEKQTQYVAQMNQVFRALLAEKARQELVEKVREDDRRRAEDARARVTDNAPRSVRIRNILKQDVTGR
jgi:hypothetical protein